MKGNNMISTECSIQQLVNGILDEKADNCKQEWIEWCINTNYEGNWSIFCNELEQIKEEGIDGIIKDYPNIENYNKLKDIPIYEYEWDGESDADGNVPNPKYKLLKDNITQWLDSYFQNLLEEQQNN